MQKLIQELIDTKMLRSKKIIRAFRNIDRADFVMPQFKNFAYADIALPIGYGQTISQPTTVAFMLELLDPRPKQKILEVGSGSGWVTAMLADIVGPKGKIFGTEKILGLTIMGRQNLRKYDLRNVEIFKAGKALGWPAEAPFDAVLVSAAGSALPLELIRQLKIGAVMVIPIGTSIYKISKKSENEITSEAYPGFAFVPLI